MSKNKNEVLIDCFMFCQEVRDLSHNIFLNDRADYLSKKLMEFGIKQPKL